MKFSFKNISSSLQLNSKDKDYSASSSMNSERNVSDTESLIIKEYVDHILKENSGFYNSNSNDEYYENFFM